MTQDEFERELYRRRPDLRPTYRQPELTANDVYDLLPDFLRAQAGTRSATEHPLVERLIREKQTLHGIRSEAGMTAVDFLSAMANSLSQLSASRFEDANADIQKIVADTVVENYKSVALPTLSMPEPSEMSEESGFKQLKFVITESARSGKLRVFGGKVRFSKSVWTSYGEFLAGEIQAYTSVFSLIEQRLIAETLEAGSLTTATSAPLTIAGLNKADNSLRDQTNGAGQKCNLSISAVVIPPELHCTARVVRAALDWPELAIIVNNSLTSATTWYAFANPQTSGALLRLKLRNAGVPVVYDSARESGPETGMSFALEHSVDFVLSGAPGLIKCTA